MDVYLLTFIAAAIVVLIVICTAFLQAMRKVRANRQARDDGEGVAVAQAGRLRRVGAVRNVRRRMQANATYRPEEDGPDRRVNHPEDNDEDGERDDKVESPDHKVGTKKRAKLAAKAEKRIQREAAEREREERKKREQHLQEERDKQAEKEQAEQLRTEEAERKAREEKEKQEYEEYLKMKEAFSVEEEGYQQENGDYEENLLQEFLTYIKLNKVLVLEDLAAHFGLKTASVVERIQQLQANGRRVEISLSIERGKERKGNVSDESTRCCRSAMRAYGNGSDDATSRLKMHLNHIPLAVHVQVSRC
ncbi:DDRGK domain-containing protein 1 isoform X1 [Temnothorax curvispinosus]|uniref:DDRGK domain-containing protein 1 n=1 Tax=Temnothorax curvispinosus TaxID=300111 RepID=A0A6J1RB49_9HYME|nr:DDRGK domain-containing protein 1 isoform X1 [Temnothorax curvispinosus]